MRITYPSFDHCVNDFCLLLLKDLKKFELAIQDLEMSFSLDSTLVDAVFQKAKCQRFNNQSDEAIKTLSFLLSIDGSYAQAAYEQGVLYYLDKNYDLAIESYSLAITI